ncbi:MAG: 50S ribosomal protein L17 [Deltaproteobacteria bacterium GWC2_42_51]|nr:MAG: 50S ribosomal protein L17 [Deltaproteobacteria bacterium GWB2_42_7]OGP32707.1 MAG: 50S ribosomal protein L17 [Deltaproteobacteria bacterium GWC2_42_51]OGP39102.1 MAG: 50S ribosomal protein L17 [Deltaproteobacteria bacterium GWD2_42_10]OGP47964.1 MAG: 50S ribosomal protein L17 [Deltaproteobacteria bacterium GWF2_42_12]OGQ24793.1 MAG: 50S ribosomal protein L17 [Deltaproteobacteria bacterium RIFCSPHIGHO2_02_FULL_42_44]OGQ36841.1 MAG: 50S ribosomal protein L17 [Deltaproteobacteria bacteriu
MRHNRDEKRFDRRVGHLRCMMANMTNSLFLHGRIRTTLPKAKELRSFAENMITLGKQGDTSARRRAMSFMRDKSVVARLFDEISLKYKDRNGGYTRILRADSRPGDSADMALIELIESGEAKEEKKGKTKKATSRKKAEASVKQGKKAA